MQQGDCSSNVSRNPNLLATSSMPQLQRDTRQVESPKFYKFVMHQPQSYYLTKEGARVNKCFKGSLVDFQVHGIWPVTNRKKPLQPKHIPDDILQKKESRKPLLRSWQTLGQKTWKAFLASEWIRHGSFQRELDALSYFMKGCELQRINNKKIQQIFKTMVLKLRKKRIFKKDKSFWYATNAKRLKGHLESKLGGNVTLVCSRYKKRLILVEIDIMYDSQSGKPTKVKVGKHRGDLKSTYEEKIWFGFHRVVSLLRRARWVHYFMKGEVKMRV